MPDVLAARDALYGVERVLSAFDVLGRLVASADDLENMRDGVAEIIFILHKEGAGQLAMAAEFLT